MAERSPRKLAVILHADVVDSTALVRNNETLAHERIQQAFQSFSRTIDSYGGTAHELRGDALVAEFDRASDAIAAALVFQTENTQFNRTLEDDIQPHLRVGIAMGEVVIADHTVTGEGVVMAQRLEQLAVTGGVCIQDAAHQTIPKRLPFEYENLGEHHLKGFDEPIKVYAVSQQPGVEIPEIEKRPQTDTAEPELPDKPSIAVLPFTNMSGDPEQEYFSDGITEDIITAMSKLRWFLVIARNSTFVYKGKAVDIKQVAQELQVNYVLEGSVRKSGNRIRVTAQLIDVVNGAHLWAERYDRDLTDIFELQDEITQSVTAAIEPKLVAAEGTRSQRRSSRDLDAWQLVVRALDHYGRMTTTESEKAIALLRQAVGQFPDYGPAHSLLAFMLLVSGHVGWAPQSDDYQYATEQMDKASKLAHRAVELDNEDPWAHLALGYLAFTQRRTEDTVRELMRATELNPNFATAYGYLGWALVFDGQSEKALSYFQQAIRMSPHDPLIAFFYSGTGVAYYYAHDYDNAIEWSGNAIRERPGFTAAHRIHCASLAQAGRTEETRAAVERLRRLQPGISIEWVEKCVPYTASAMPHFLEGLRKAGID